MAEQPRLSKAPPGWTIWPALQAGAVSGLSGAVYGSVVGVLRDSSPPLFALATGAQWFALGGTYWGLRSGILQIWKPNTRPSHNDKLVASGAAGALTGGGMGYLLRGRANVIPGAIMFSIFGISGQTIVEFASRQQVRNQANNVPAWRRIVNSKWFPMKLLSDDEYAEILAAKVLKLDVEIEAIDEEIRKTKAAEEHTPESNE